MADNYFVEHNIFNRSSIGIAIVRLYLNSRRFTNLLAVPFDFKSNGSYHWIYKLVIFIIIRNLKNGNVN